MRTCRTFVCLAVAAALSPASAEDVVIDDFEGPVKWAHNRDGGTTLRARPDTKHVKHGKAALRLTYTDAPPHWSNLRRAVAVPPGATAVAMWLQVHSATRDAAMHFWLFEPDRDGWVARAGPRDKTLADLRPGSARAKRGSAVAKPGWHEVVVPISAFRFQPRGGRTRQMASANAMLIGCNFANLDVTIDHLRFLVRKEPQVTSLSKTEDLRIGRGKRGGVAILADDLPRTAGAASVEKLAELAGEMGYGVTLLKAGDAADAAVLNRKNFDVLIVPCAPAYPRAGRAAVLAFLKGGGALISIGGYAFDKLLVKAPDGWAAEDPTLRVRDMDKVQAKPDGINTRFGRPGDTMRLKADQVGAFDPAYLLKHVASAATAPGQVLLKDRLRIDAPVAGYAACAMTGSNSPVFPDVYGRWIPILNGYDSLGRLRGAAAAVVHHWAGPFAGSSWAIFGVTNRDLIGEPKAGAALFRAALAAVTESAYLHGLKTDLACYRQGESVRGSVQVTNRGRSPRKVRVRFQVGSGQAVEKQATVEAGKTQTVQADLHDGKTALPAGRFDGDFHNVAARLIDADTGEAIDQMETAFVVWDEKVLASGPKIGFEDNYFTIGGTPRLLCGTNQTGMMWYSEHEDPWVWQRDFAKMQASGVRMLRILHFSPFAARDPRRWGAEGGVQILKKLPPGKKFLRQTDAIVQLAQKHGVVIFLSLHDWIGVDLSDAELEIQRRWNRFWAKRYRDVPGILYDVQNEPSVALSQQPDLVRFYNERLKARYGTPARLREAWGKSAPPPGRNAWTLKPQPGSNDWADIRTLDANRFKVDTLNRWIEANVKGIREGDADALATVGYLQMLDRADKILGVAHTDFSNMHYHGPLGPFAAQFKIIDRRFVGKGLSVGEFGAVEGHNARVRGQTGTRPDESIRRFLAMPHWAFGLGGSAVLNWDWKDFDDCVFPWGLNHHCDLVPKPELYVYRNTSLFLERLRPRYEDPGVWLLLPDSHRLGARWRQNHAALFRMVQALIEGHVDFNVANEYDLDEQRPPAACRAILWPIPYCPDDAAFERVLKFVRDGGSLYLSGDVSYDPLRRRTRTDRLAKLGLKDVGAHPPFARRPAGAVPIQRARVGKGKVFYVPRPIELEGGPLGKVLREFLAFAGVKPIAVQPDAAGLHVFTVPLADGALTLLCNRTGARQDVRLAGATLTVGRDLTGMLVTRKDGSLLGIECTGRSAAKGKPLTAGDAHVMIQSLDGRPCKESKRLAVFGILPGTLTLHTSAEWADPVLDVGEFDAAAWRSLATRPIRPAGSAFTIRLDEGLARSILVLRERTAQPGLPRADAE